MSVMFFISLVVILFAVMCYQTCKISSMRKQDDVLYAFRELHDDALLFMVDNFDSETISMKDKHSIRKIIGQIDLFILHFDKAKMVFNFRNFSNLIHDIKGISQNLDKMEIKANPDVLRLNARLGRCLVLAFWRFIPFFRFRLLFNLFYFMVKLFVVIGLKKFKSIEQGFKQYDLVSKKYNHLVEPC